MALSFGPSITSPSWNIPASTGWTPKPTSGPLHQKHNGLLRRDTVVGRNTCGWINGDQNQPFTCDSSSTCVADPQANAFACCDAVGNCDFATACYQGPARVCFIHSSGDCSGVEWTIGCMGGSCVTYTVPGQLALTLADCVATPAPVDIQTTYAGGPANQQVPFPYSQYIVSASSAAAVSSTSAAAAASASASSLDAASSDWVSQHKALLIGVVACVAVLFLLGCCGLGFRRRRRTRGSYAPARQTAQTQGYHYPPQQTRPGMEDYPMTQYQYGPNK